jgi:hypothetical protein
LSEELYLKKKTEEDGAKIYIFFKINSVCGVDYIQMAQVNIQSELFFTRLTAIRYSRTLLYGVGLFILDLCNVLLAITCCD